MSRHPPQVRGRVKLHWLAMAAALAIATTLTVELASQSALHPRHAEMLAAAHAMEAASEALVEAKEARGLMQAFADDPNRTGMIGSEYTPLTTTLGDLSSKRTTTNPDFAAALVRQIAALDLPPATPVVIIISGSFVGADIAAIAAVEALHLRPVVVASAGASMWGATDPDLNLIDIAALLRERGIIAAKAVVAVLGGESGVGRDMDPAGVAALRASAARDSVPLVELRPLAALVDALVARVETVLAGERPGLIVSVGGALIGLGACREAFDLQPGLSKQPPRCSTGTPGLALRLAQEKLPILHLLNMRRLALELGLPYDPEPLPKPGENAAVYGRGNGGGEEVQRGK